MKVFASIFTLGALLCLGISLTMYPWGVSTVQAVGAVMALGVVDVIVSFLFASLIAVSRD